MPMNVHFFCVSNLSIGQLSMKKIFFLLFIFTTSQICFSEEQMEDVKISAFLHLSGEYSMEGAAFREGLELALDEVNKTLVEDGVKISLDIQDTRYLSREVVTLAHRASADSDVKGVIVSTFNEIKPIGPIVEQAKLPTIVLWDATPEIDNFGEYVFSIGPWAPDTGQKCARFAISDLKSKHASIVLQEHDWSLAVAKAFEKRFTGSERTLDRIILSPDESDFKSLLLKLRIKKPDVVYAPLVFAISTFVKQFKIYLPGTPLIMSDNLNEHLVDQDQKSFEGIYHSSVADPDNETSRKLIELYEVKFGKSPKLLMFNAWGYDSLLMFGEVVGKGARSREEIKTALYKIQGLKGSSGDISVLPTGSAPKYISMFKVRGGKLKLISGIDPE